MKGIRSRRCRRIIIILSIGLPQRLKIEALRRLLGWTIGSGVYIGFSYIDVETVVLADNVHIGHFNLIRNLGYLAVGRGTFIKDFNSFFGGGELNKVGFPSHLEIGANVKFMSHHFIDCAGKLVIGDDTTIGGRSTEFYTHERSMRTGVPVLEPTEVVIGSGVYVGARCCLVSCVIPYGAIVGAGAVVVRDHSADGADGSVLLAGNPARVRKHYPDPSV